MKPPRSKPALALAALLVVTALVAPALAKPGKGKGGGKGEGKGGGKPAAVSMLTLTLDNAAPEPAAPVTATALVTQKVKGQSTPVSGVLVSFSLDGVFVGEVPTVDGIAAYTVAAPADGEHVIKASYVAGKKTVLRAKGFTVTVPVPEPEPSPTETVTPEPEPTVTTTPLEPEPTGF